jgi:TPR repeat protein
MLQRKPDLAVMYWRGLGVPQNTALAISWILKAAGGGDADAQYLLGLAYYEGKNVPQDYVEAHKWFNLAASRFVSNEEGRRKAVHNREAVAERMTPAQVGEAQKLARE